MSAEFTLAELRGAVVIAALIATKCGDGEPSVSPKEADSLTAGLFICVLHLRFNK